MATVTKTGSFKELTALSDAEGVNNSPLNVKQYKDLDLFFTKKVIEILQLRMLKIYIKNLVNKLIL